MSAIPHFMPGASWDGEEGRVVVIIPRDLPSDFAQRSGQRNCYVVGQLVIGKWVEHDRKTIHPTSGGWGLITPTQPGWDKDSVAIAVYEKFLKPQKNEFGELAP